MTVVANQPVSTRSQVEGRGSTIEGEKAKGVGDDGGGVARGRGDGEGELLAPSEGASPWFTAPYALEGEVTGRRYCQFTGGAQRERRETGREGEREMEPEPEPEPEAEAADGHQWQWKWATTSGMVHLSLPPSPSPSVTDWLTD